MDRKSSAHYQREFRRRLREKGLIKKEVWIRPEHTKQLATIEKCLRTSAGLKDNQGVSPMDKTNIQWNTTSLHTALLTAEPFTQGSASIEKIDGIEPTLHLIMHDYGDLPIFLTVSGEQIIAEAVLWQAADVIDLNTFNEAVLRTHKYFPLSTISLDAVAGQADYYHMFGALSSASILPNIMFEIEVLATNVLQATEAYSEFLNIAIEA